jgi:hypothetical protein
MYSGYQKPLMIMGLQYFHHQFKTVIQQGSQTCATDHLLYSLLFVQHLDPSQCVVPLGTYPDYMTCHAL